MGIALKTLYVYLGINLFFYFLMPATYTGWNDGILGNFMDIDSGTATFDGTTASSKIPQSTEEDSAVVGTGSLSLVSTFRMVWNFIKFVAFLIVAPLIVAYLIPGIPIGIVILIALPGVVSLSFGVISAIRGWDI